VTVCVGMRNDGEVVRGMSCMAKILKCSKIYFQGVTTCYDEIVKCACVTLSVTHFVNNS